MANKASELKNCPDCGSLNVIYNAEKDELICKDCGLIYAQYEEKKTKK